MEELLFEFENAVRNYRYTVERLKKHNDYPECGHYYSIIIKQTTLEAFESAMHMVERFRKKRVLPSLKFQSEEFKRILEVERKFSYGYLAPATEDKLINYMKTLEFIIEHLEDQIVTMHKRELERRY